MEIFHFISVYKGNWQIEYDWLKACEPNTHIKDSELHRVKAILI